MAVWSSRVIPRASVSFAAGVLDPGTAGVCEAAGPRVPGGRHQASVPPPCPARTGSLCFVNRRGNDKISAALWIYRRIRCKGESGASSRLGGPPGALFVPPLRSRLSRCPDWGPCRAPCHAELPAIALAPRCTWRSPRVRDRVVFGFASMAFSMVRLSHGDPPAAARRFLVCRAPLPPANSCEPHWTLGESRQVSLLPSGR